MINPQYRLTVHPPSGRPSSANQVRVEATARAARTLPVNVVAVWANGVRVFEFVQFVLILRLLVDIFKTFGK